MGEPVPTEIIEARWLERDATGSNLMPRPFSAALNAARLAEWVMAGPGSIPRAEREVVLASKNSFDEPHARASF